MAPVSTSLAEHLTAKKKPVGDQPRDDNDVELVFQPTYGASFRTMPQSAGRCVGGVEFR
jgi:hypothetical protein